MQGLEAEIKKFVVKDIQWKNSEAKEQIAIDDKEAGILQKLFSDSRNDYDNLVILCKDTNQRFGDARILHEDIVDKLEDTMQDLQE